MGKYCMKTQLKILFENVTAAIAGVVLAAAVVDTIAGVLAR